MSYDLIVVGAGFFGATVAERAACDGKKVLVVEKRSHLGGNSYSEIDAETGIECHKYGSHIFHTSNKAVWDYINKFTAFNDYRHKVLTISGGKVYPMPISLFTINSFYGTNIKPFEVEDFINKQISKEQIPPEPENLEQQAISLIGRGLYEAFIQGYTQKQWDKHPSQLPSYIIKRLPFRTNYCTDYFDDTFQGVPLGGYAAVFDKMFADNNIEVRLNTDYFALRQTLPSNIPVVYTGAIDRFFDYKFGRLEWRTVEFEREVYDVEDYQGTAVMNYADADIPYTRIHEYKHYHPEREKLSKTVVFKEYSKFATGSDDPYYPINTEENTKLLSRYQEQAKECRNVHFCGRLGEYKYYDMDDTIEKALLLYDKLKEAL